MGWKVSSLIFLLGIPMVGICATALYLLYNKDDENEDIHGIMTSRATVLEMKIPKAIVGVVIGRGGSNLKEIELNSDTKINFKDDEDNDESRTCEIRGSNEAVRLAEAMIHEFIMNQPLIETFEMWAPRISLGRIIGRGGESIRNISRASNAKVSVDRVPSSGQDGDHRIIIKGTSEQIVVAKSLIEEKIEEDIEARRKLELSVANRSPRTKPNKALCMTAANSKEDESADHAAEKLVSVSSDGFLEVYVSAVCNPLKFWVQIISPKTVELDHLVDQMTDYYQLEVNRELHALKEVSVGQIVAAPFDYDKKWYRAEVCKIELNDYNEDESKLDLYYVDYGDSGYKKLCEVFQLRTDFLKLRFQAIECSLAGIKSSGEVWSEEAIDQFEELNHVAQWRPLKARIVSYKENDREGSPTPCVDLFDTSATKDINIGAELISRGYAVAEDKKEQPNLNGDSFCGKNNVVDSGIEINEKPNGCGQHSDAMKNITDEVG